MRCGSGRRADGVELEVVHDVAEERRQLDAVALLRSGHERGLANWPAMRPIFTRRHAGAVREHQRHLEDHLELVADVVGRELGERLRAVAGVQQEPVALGDARERRAQRARLAREHERRHRAQLGERVVERGRVGPHRAAARRGSAASSSGSQSSSATTAARTSQSALRGRRRAVRPAVGLPELEGAPLAHLLELLLRLHLLGEQRRLDAVEEAFEPADELGLRDAQLGFARRVAR